jgi:very-short-patch-repair endonuclease
MRRSYSSARLLRKNSTDPEKILWRIFRNRNFFGVKFKRQHCIDHYIVDFYAAEHKLIIELDGGQHATNQKQDSRRTKFLEQRGYRVIRFWNSEISENMDGVLEVIKSEIDRTSPRPSPLKERVF